ncbi:hypothetical protein SADO_16653 [Salinisphaera dokdonensis CL-ES53]|uniref:Lipoprotein n=1 Tax=Salinisphaera dokdonensis CL-ES53 TaxID=1304272 RepID=A0ABV2B4T0_9GAMM
MTHDDKPGKTMIGTGRAAALAAGLALLLVLAGCGSDDESPSTNTEKASPDEKKAAMADARTIRERVIGNTVTGTMSPDSAYTEFYAADGSIHGASYEARWTIEDDQLCFDYDESPQIDCYGVKIDGESVEWHRQDEVQGKGTLVEGNPNNF